MILLLVFTSQTLFAQVDMSEQEKIQQQRDKNRQEDALQDSARQANPKTSAPVVGPVNIDPSAQLDVDHSALGYSLIPTSDNTVSGIKFSGGFTAGFYQEQKLEKRYVLLAGVELPIETEMLPARIIPFGGGGLQVGGDGGLYVDLGLDFRLVNWFKLQGGVHYVVGRKANGLIGAALTW